MNYYSISGILIILIAILYIFLLPYNEAYNRKDIQFIKLSTQPTKIQPTKSKVLIFNSFAYTGNIPEYATYSSLITKAYADKYGYTYKQYNHSSEAMPPYWLRVRDTYEALISEEYDIIVYLDLDATFHDFDMSIDDVLSRTLDPTLDTTLENTDISNSEYNFYVGADPIKIERPDFNNLLNTGCFIVKNTMWSKTFIQLWMNVCMNNDGNLAGVCESSWKYTDKKWNCPGCKWAGIKYEQGALANLYIMNAHEARKHVCIFDESVLSNTSPMKKSYVLHLMGSSNNERTNIFKNISREILA